MEADQLNFCFTVKFRVYCILDFKKFRDLALIDNLGFPDFLNFHFINNLDVIQFLDLDFVIILEFGKS